MYRFAIRTLLVLLPLAGTAGATKVAVPTEQAAAREALAVAERRHPAPSREVADALAAVVDAQRADFTIELDGVGAEALARREVEMRRTLDGENSIPYAHALVRLGYAMSSHYANTDAVAQFDRAKAIVDALGDKATPAERAGFALDQGYGWRNQRTRYAEAVALIESAIAIDPALPPLRRARAHVWTVSPLLYLGKPERSVEMLEKAKKALADANLPTHPLHADILRMSALLAHERGEFATGMQLIDQALAAAENAKPYSPALHTAVVHTRGQIATVTGDTESARKWFDKEIALENERMTLGGYPLAMVHFELCNTLAPAGKFAEAEPHCRAAIERLEGLPSPPPLELGATNFTLGSVLIDLDRREEAREPLRASVAYAEKTSLTTPWVFGAEQTQASMLFLDGHVAEAEALYRKNLARYPAHGDFSSRSSSRSAQILLAGALWEQHRTDEAFALASDAEQSAALVRRISATDLDERHALEAKVQGDGGLERMIAIAAQTHDAKQVHAVWDAALDLRGQVRVVAARRLASARASADPKLAALWDDWKKANAAIAQARVTLARAPDDKAYAALTQAENEFNAAELKLAAATGGTGDRLVAARRGIDDVLAALPRRSALVSFVEFERDRPLPGSNSAPAPTQLFALVADGSKPPTLVALGDSAPVAALVEDWYRLASNAKSSADDVSAASRKLRRHLWDPLGTVHRAERVFIAPSAAVTRLNFAALERDDGTLLLDDGPVFHTLDHERDLLAAPAPSTKPALLVAGAPDFATAAPGAQTRGDCPGLRTAPFRALPGAQLEIDALARLAAEAHVTAQRIDGGAAREAAVRSALPGHSLVHFATHGVYLGEHCGDADDTATTRGLKTVDTQAKPTPADLRPLAALVFSGANEASDNGEDDGLLTSEEISALDLSSVEWAVLSACETALGAVTAHDGVLGLRRAFHLAGARTVIMSLWRVDDRATATFMTELYRARLNDHATTDAAMRSAMRATLASRRKAGESTHPAYWAAFIAVGAFR
jgi:prepilin-type processing-associated H-X9-DG protein